ncbi:mitochondrial septum site-determining protein MinC [Andalucia godoyi]|uniref:Mitochondrial MinC n=1 Tax=Andalucia godoyi TaxID=505711 RepID=A0A0E3SU86_ANDGO|nr:mitochondrial MinC [Andalucia godoyi]KAF0852583.1 mitochondrial septum site-determining protein MinC [Andalucia godoyi]|eukprot:AKB90671.1 mitochondrial septum site-determining protein MinC
MNVIAKTYILPTLRLTSSCTLSSVVSSLTNKASFFRGSPMVVDGTSLVNAPQIERHALFEAMRSLGVIPIDVQATGVGSAAAAGSREDQHSHGSRSSVRLTSPPMVHTGHVRSGQMLYAQGRDLIVIGNVHPGAEVIADGSIHVLGKLAGRAIAGVHADSAHAARHLCVSCARFSPEIVAIGGLFSVCEEVPKGAVPDAEVVAFLNDENEIVYISSEANVL